MINLYLIRNIGFSPSRCILQPEGSLITFKGQVTCQSICQTDIFGIRIQFKGYLIINTAVIIQLCFLLAGHIALKIYSNTGSAREQYFLLILAAFLAQKKGSL